MTARIWQVLHVEDLLWTATTAIVGASGADLLDTSAGRGFLAAASIVFLIAGATAPPIDRRARLFALVPAVIIPDAVLRGEPPAIRIAFVIAAAALVGFALLQDGRWVRLPPRARRVMTWPYLTAMGDFVGALLGRGVDPNAAHPLLVGRTTGETCFRIALALGALLPIVYAAFVAAPRAVGADDRAPWRTWAYRYLVALAGAASAVAIAGVTTR